MTRNERTQLSQEAWLVVADSRRARLMSTTVVARRQRLQIEHIDDLEVEFVNSEHSRPSPRSRRVAYSYASRHHEDREKTAAFARQLVEFLERHLGTAPRRLVLFAPASFLSVLRRIMPKQLAGRTTGHEGEFVNFTCARLAAHRGVTALFLP